ncbi:dipeptide ABC transporter ATP-binding protein [Streptomyces sp. TRM66268-LWL]|uniref:Dipeptide ABC transporter ATP-binding protein n=1 Tax=Streptomyces polyasparticus TaxID=2767826 RepID=A0ABR7S7R6_9ACTN|nr:dipeptide ABC transporter ATP-binding protein [Streptomyces polyasparticus]MBC9711511.1 dipeptide ABC transporter ATP-binding protein [Streptomyces polyasparticus]
MSLLELNDVKVHFPIKKGLIFDRTVGHVYAVDGISLKVEAGQTYGLVGESGCGKTTLGRAVLRLVDITSGEVVLDGTDLASLPDKEMRTMRRRLQMVFQDPLGSLNPRQNIESILSEGMAAHGIGADQAERREKIRAILAKVGLPSNALSRYPHEFSGGQRQRIGIARALVLEPDVIICDEPVSALDVSIQAQVVNLLDELQEELGLTYVVIAHDLAVVRHISDVIGVMYLGSLVEEAPSDSLYAEPKHPYTKALMSAVPIPDPTVEEARERILLTGDLPSPANPPSGCRFHTRCPWAQPKCKEDRPQLREVGEGHRVACHFVEDIDSGLLQIGANHAAVVPAARTEEAGIEAAAAKAAEAEAAAPKAAVSEGAATDAEAEAATDAEAGQAPEAESAEEAVETEAAETEAVEAEAAETEAAETEAVETEAAATETDEIKPSEAEAAETDSTEPAKDSTAQGA